MLWVSRGNALWDQPAGREGRACAGCHGAVSSMKSVATRYPQIDRGDGGLINLEGRFEHVLFVIRQDIEMTDRTFILED